MSKEQRLSFIEPHEEKDAKKAIDSLFVALTKKPFNFRPAGYYVAVKIHVTPDQLKEGVREDGSKYTLWTPPSMQSEEKYQSVSALVCAVGPEAFGANADGTPRYPTGYKINVGDFVCIPRYESFMFSYRGVAMALLPDDRIMGVVEDPADVQAAHLADKI